MKRVVYMSFILVMATGLSFKIYAASNPSEKHEFKSTDREVNFDIERKQGEVALYLQSQVFGAYQTIEVERSEGDNAGYSVCKTIELSRIKTDGGYYATADKFPLPAKADCYYRIRTIAKDGTVKMYPPVLLAALIR
jgi:hypothetical protein